MGMSYPFCYRPTVLPRKQVRPPTQGDAIDVANGRKVVHVGRSGHARPRAAS